MLQCVLRLECMPIDLYFSLQFQPMGLPTGLLGDKAYRSNWTPNLRVVHVIFCMCILETHVPELS